MAKLDILFRVNFQAQNHHTSEEEAEQGSCFFISTNTTDTCLDSFIYSWHPLKKCLLNPFDMQGDESLYKGMLSGITPEVKFEEPVRFNMERCKRTDRRRQKGRKWGKNREEKVQLGFLFQVFNNRSLFCMQRENENQTLMVCAVTVHICSGLTTDVCHQWAENSQKHAVLMNVLHIL